MNTKIRQKIAAALKARGCTLVRRTLAAPDGRRYKVNVVTLAAQAAAPARPEGR